jgi:hypothetical protein
MATTRLRGSKHPYWTLRYFWRGLRRQPRTKPLWLYNLDRRWDIRLVWSEGAGKVAGKPYRALFIDSPLFRLDAGLFPGPGWQVKFRKGTR